MFMQCLINIMEMPENELSTSNLLFLAATLIRQLLSASDIWNEMMERIKAILLKWVNRDFQDRSFMLVLADIAKYDTQVHRNIANNILYA